MGAHAAYRPISTLRPPFPHAPPHMLIGTIPLSHILLLVVIFLPCLPRFVLYFMFRLILPYFLTTGTSILYESYNPLSHFLKIPHPLHTTRFSFYMHVCRKRTTGRRSIPPQESESAFKASENSYYSLSCRIFSSNL